MALIGNLSMYRMFSKDAAKLGAFYHEVLEIPIEWSDDNIVILNTGPCKIGIESGTSEEDLDNKAFLGISFETADIEKTVTTLKERGVRIVGKPEKQYWGGTLAHFEDPDGHTVTLVEYPN